MKDENKKIINQAVKLAQKRAQNRTWQKGDTVAHPDQPITMEIKAIEGQMALIGWEGKYEYRPICELFNPTEAGDIALNILTNPFNGS